jgi:hypothetical protein
VINWMFASPARWFRVRLWSGVSLLVLVILFGSARCSGPGHSAPAAATPVTTVTSTALTPAWSPSPTEGVSTPAPADPIALEAVSAFLAHDVDRFADLALPGAAELMAGSPPASGVLTGPVRTVHGGPTQQDLDVPTSLGTLRLQMVWRTDRWLVADMAFR